MALALALAACHQTALDDENDDSERGPGFSHAAVRAYDECAQVEGDARTVINQGYQPKPHKPSPPTGLYRGDFHHSGQWTCSWEFREETVFGKAYGCLLDEGCTSITTELLTVDYFAGLFGAGVIQYPLDRQKGSEGQVHPFTRQDVLHHLQHDPRHGPRRYEIIDNPLLADSDYHNIVIVREHNDGVSSDRGLLDSWRFHMLVFGLAPQALLEPGDGDTVFLGYSRVTISQQLRWGVVAARGYREAPATRFRPESGAPVSHDAVVNAFLAILGPWEVGSQSDLMGAVDRYQEQLPGYLSELEQLQEEAEEAVRAMEELIRDLEAQDSP